MPGHSFNYADWIRDSLVLAIHSQGFGELKNEKSKEALNKNLYSQFLLPKNAKVAGPHDKFLDCINDGPSEECTKIAVRDEIVPSFEEYAKSIDALISLGEKPSCDFVPAEAVDISGTGGNK